MKKLIVCTLAIAGLALSTYGQGVIYFDGSYNSNPALGATSEGMVFISGVLDTGTDINASLLYWNGSIYTPVVTMLLSTGSGPSGTEPFGGASQPAAGDITFGGNGGLYDNSGNPYQGATPTYPSGTVMTFEVQGWLGAYSSYAAAVGNAAVGQTASFTETLIAATSPIPNDIEGMPALNLVTVPEPSTLVLAGLGGLSLLMIRRRK